MKPRVQLQRTLDGAFSLVIAEDVKGEAGTSVRVAEGFTWSTQPEGAMWAATTGIHDVDGLVQSIVDAAWEAGFRPTGFSDVKNETAAIRDHLKDMRTVAFHKLGIKADD